ncbi:hypothetical protein PHYPSEUDO_014703 [Phytophthora pseudosyringae]|uniref:Uncharacterized protein n=1 Tax=Phytophthora pseudosyringae TaxID=221518 RepID=A0A8T1V4Y1_9STRA|nr:hypothetical protein PHYPSEUDO_014703 [Phytophthora pseudosyringae]
MVETSFIHPVRSSSVAAAESSPRQSSRTRRRGGEESDLRSPSELLKEIGVAGAEVVKVIKGRGWEICEPKGLEEHKRYYLPGGRANGENATRGEHYVVGEGELYAYVLERGGTSYLFPSASQPLALATALRLSSSRDISAPRTAETPTERNCDASITRRSALFESGEDTDLVEYFSDENCSSASRQRKKRRKNKNAPERAQPTGLQNQQPSDNVIVVDDNPDTDSAASRDRRISEDQVRAETSTRPGHRSEVEQYETALKLNGCRVQLLKDVDVNLLRAVAAIAFRKAALPSPDRERGESQSTHALHELERFAERIQVARNCLSYTVAAIVDQGDNSSGSDTFMSEIDIPSFVSTGQGRLMLMQDIERYVLLVGQALRPFTYSDRANSAGRSSNSVNVRPLQRHIDKTTAELLELSLRVCGRNKRGLRGKP